ncbi:LOW QUALITY PROTEIN: phosphatidylinositol polyphosphate 5-phosphatase type IV-like [Haliotis rubra]|uniref:LOW QUALITY PROTEIN: phosphatidylinositol polyphosphate 5-phosphatase type IV-like n=1 Tax=Haliotis rubra TaxID=36100 RepID=UPI001EE5EA51|nr:LOW QUALITY PROTEIN: phosphatidylinositol polyphosphate 5-phosphatase type IV-like [Haliotis rubra]
MEIDEMALSDDDKDCLQGSQTDATLHRFRNLRMATERSGSVESLKSSPFVPKPPSTPKKSARGSSSKGEKRTRDPNSSGDEPDQGHKRLVSQGLEDFNVNANDSNGANNIVQSSSTDNSQLQDSTVPKSRRKLREHLNKEFDNADFSFGHSVSEPKSEVVIGSISDLKAVSDQYESILSMDAKEKTRTPRSARLPPVSPKSRPPPLGQNIASKSLRTTYKSDLYPEKFMSSQQSNLDCLSERSFVSSSVMTAITTRQARERNFLVGNSSTQSLLGSEELERYFPSKEVHIFVGTWNMNEIKIVPDNINDFLLPQTSMYVQDIYCVCTQENGLNKRDWEVKIQETLGPSHVMYHSASHGSLHLAIFIRRDLIWFCSAPEDDFVTTRAMTMVRTKGSIACCFSMFGSSYLFLNCHFTPDVSKKKERLNDYMKILQGIKLPKSSSMGTPRSGDSTNNFDSVFFWGDLNFRIERKKAAVEGMVDHIEDQQFKNYENLLGGDQLSKFMVEGKIFQGFQEGRINFQPSYKFDPKTDQYDTSHKSRIPSYTDRILFRCKKKNWVQCVQYDCVMSVRHSDHKPVFGVYETCIKAGKEGAHLSGGQFDRSVYMDGNKKRAMHMVNGERSQKASSVCSIQ